MSVLKVIQAKLEFMTDAERQIGQFIVDDPDRMVQLSSAELAAATGRSQSSVVKFSQKIGYDGYQQLKLAVTKAKAQEWRVPSGMIHGTIDENVHPQNTLLLAEALQKAGKPFDLMLYPGNRHGIGDKPQRRHLFQTIADYVLANL